MDKPRILLSGYQKLQNYADAVNGSGGIADARYLPPIDVSYDGLILCGGSDFDPKYFGEEMDGSVDIDKARDETEFALLKAYVEAGKPILGICRGHQLINVFFGGSLYQDLKSAAEHTSYANHDMIHRVRAVEGSIAHKLYGEEFTVNSSHHQGIKKLGDGLKATMYTVDGTVNEGIEHETLPILGVQWHPERMSFSNQRNDTVDGKPIFEYFVQMCIKNR